MSPTTSGEGRLFTCSDISLEVKLTLSEASGTKFRGAVFTRREVVDFILDLVGYTEDKPLYRNRILEPSFGCGNFLLPIVDRLLKAWRKAKKPGDALDDLGDAIRAVELHRESFQSTHAAVVRCSKGKAWLGERQPILRIFGFPKATFCWLSSMVNLISLSGIRPMYARK